MTDLEYIQMRLGEDTCTDLERDVARASEERSIAIRGFFSGRADRIRGFLQHISSTPLLNRLGRSGSSGVSA